MLLIPGEKKLFFIVTWIIFDHLDNYSLGFLFCFMSLIKDDTHTRTNLISNGTDDADQAKLLIRVRNNNDNSDKVPDEAAIISLNIRCVCTSMVLDTSVFVKKLVHVLEEIISHDVPETPGPVSSQSSQSRVQR